MGDGTLAGADHATHDPELIVALLDDDLDATERALGEALIAACPACASLHDDLAMLARATHVQTPPTRPRDFRLTPADAARLTAASRLTPSADEGPREPLAIATRLSGDMHDPRTAAAHATHDAMLVASFADHSLALDERVVAERLVAGCGLCAALHEDLLAIRTATIQLPTPARPRDYALTEADAARLRRSGWRRWVGAFGSPRDAVSRPLAVGLTTLGIVGLLVAGAPLLSFGSAASSGGPSAGGAAGAPVTPPQTGNGTSEAAAPAASNAPAPAPAATSAAAPLVPVPAVTAPAFAADQGGSSDTTSGGPKATGGGLTNPVDATGVPGNGPVEPTGAPPLVALSGILLLVGLGLFLLRWMSRRFGA
jgi:hypothetical protein